MRRVLTILATVAFTGGVPGVANAFHSAFVAIAPPQTVATSGTTGSASVELDDGDAIAFATPITGLRPDDEIPDDDAPADAFAERLLTIRNTAPVATSLRVGVGPPPGGTELPGLRVSARRSGTDEEIVPDAAVPLASTPITVLGAGEDITVRFRFRLAHDAPDTVIGTATVVRVTIVAATLSAGNR